MSDAGHDECNAEFDLKKIKNSKAQIKSELTRFKNFLNKTDVSIELLQARYDAIKPILGKFQLIQTQFEELLLSDFPDYYDENELEKERDEFETRYFEAIATADVALNKNSLNNSVSASTETAATHAHSMSQTNANGGVTLPQRISAKLPLLALPEFCGSYNEWQRFRDMFQAIVHNNGALSNVQRFYYLEASLKGEPKNIIASLTPTDANYNTAWELLSKRYENKKLIINTHLKEIMDMPALTKESHTSLRNFSNTFFKNYRCLESLGENVREWDTILIYILVSKLDATTKREWEIHCKDLVSAKIDNFNEFLARRCQILEALDTKPCSSTKKSYETRSLVSTGTTYRPKCPHCKDQHFIYFCDKFKELSVSERLENAKKMRLCTNCLRYGHKLSECRSSGCKICHQKHATLLHRSQENAHKNANKDDQSTQENNTEHPQVNSVTTNTCQNVSSCFILLSTAIVNAFDKDKNIVPCRVMLDSASQSNFVTLSMAKKLNVQTSKIDIPVIGINQVKTKISRKAEISVGSRHTGFKTKLSFLILPTITELSPQSYFDISKLNIPEELRLADPSFNVPAEIDMLLGCEIFYELLCIGQIKLGKNLPTLQKTLLGWIISGRVPCGQGKIGKSDVALSNCFVTQNSLDKNLENFWLIEEVTPNPRATMTREEIECENHFKETTTRNETGRFVVRFPLRNNYVDLGESEQTALSRLYSIEKRLSKNPELKESYVAFMREYQDLGHMSEISRDLPSSKIPIYYIPHHCVEKPDSTTTKLRVVFDAACKTSNNISLNNVLKVGPTIQNDLFSTLLRFRKHNLVVIGDLTKMYRQVLIDKNERNLQRIVWRNSPNEEVKHFQLNTITYGTASASFLATRCLLEISLRIAENFPIESDIIASDFYVDDLLTGSSDLTSLVLLRQNICRILSDYGFQLRKFQSNDHKILDDINRNNHGTDKYSITDDSTVKTLGVSWIPNRDEFEYNSHNKSTEYVKVTKRTILSFVAKIFDPLGVLGPLSMRAKLIIQKLWQLKIDWDESIPNQLYSEWLDLKNEIAQVGLMRVPRHVIVKQPKLIEIHGFSDASESAYACCIYLRSVDTKNHIESHLLCARSRVAPLKSLTIPRLELMGALLLARLMAKCINALKLEINQTFFWTDSTIVLCWIANEPRSWKTFIANRVAEIQQLTKIEEWNYVRSESNPADVISRGANIKNLISSDLWLHGPAFFIETEKWPQNSNISNFTRSTEGIPESKTKLNVTLAAQNVVLDIFEKFSSLNKLIRVVAYCKRFLNNLRTSSKSRIIGKLNQTEILESELSLLKLVQSQTFFAEIHALKNKNRVSSKSKLKSLSPFIDDNDIVRVGGRLKQSDIPYQAKHPILLPAKHPFTRLIVEHEHVRTMHSGVQGTLSHVRQKYWPVNGKRIVKSCIMKCVRCFKSCAKNNILPKMGDLPKFRITPSRPFLSVAADYAGPFELKDGKTRSKRIIKAYICIFVCLVTKAVHIEVITDLTSDGFLSLLKRFVSRRGFCSYIYSDNATNFVGCNNELISIQKLVESSTVQNYVVHSNIKWHFMPAKSPHFGGLHEAAVKSCKHHLRRVLNSTHLTYEEFYTLTTQIEAIMNSRPLVPMSPDPNDLNAITPAHFLIGHELTALPERDLTNDKVNHVKRYRHMQLMGQHFWARWRKEYLHHLQERNKWQVGSGPKLEIGSLVLIKEDHVPPMHWPLGRITEAHPGKDGIIRVVSVKTRSGVFKRAVAKIALLPVE